jgi:transposase InsO family protein
MITEARACTHLHLHPSHPNRTIRPSSPLRRSPGIRYADRLGEIGAVRSVGSKGDSYDNAAAESLNSLYKRELDPPRQHERTPDFPARGTGRSRSDTRRPATHLRDERASTGPAISHSHALTNRG